jgi:hypothetical protein
MARKATGQVLERKGKGGRTYALRFHAYGKRRYLTLGTDAEGWDRRRAEEELQNVLADVRRGVWRPQERIEHAELTPEPTVHEFLVRGPERAQTGTNPLVDLPRAADSSVQDGEETRSKQGKREVGRAGLEPATSSLSRRSGIPPESGRVGLPPLTSGFEKLPFPCRGVGSGRLCSHFVATLDRQGLAEVVVQQVHVRGERESRGVVA